MIAFTGCGTVLWSIAVIIFQIVDTPRSKGAGILLLKTITGCPSTAGKLGGIRIDTQLQSLGVNIVGKCLDAIREFLWVWNDVIMTVTTSLPQVIYKDVFVTGIAETVFYHSIGSFLDQLFTDVTFKEVPCHPSHRRSFC